MTKLFIGLAAFLLLLVGVAAAKDAHDKGYLSIQQQYLKDYPSSAKLIDVKTQQLFPSFAEAKQGDTFRVERCISCHVPDIATIGPQEAAKRLSQDFFKYEPDAQAIASANHLTGVHPAVVTQQYYDAFGQNAVATKDGFHPYIAGTASSSSNASAAPNGITGFLPQFISPQQNGGQALGIDQVGCIIYHNGSRLELDETHAHTNLIINPEYAWTEGASLYYQFCASCHGNLGEGKIGPPLNNQDRLGFFNEDYYYRCIEYGFTDFEHYGSVMPNWGAIANDFTYDPTRDKQQPSPVRILSETQIQTLVQFIRHWENYTTQP